MSISSGDGIIRTGQTPCSSNQQVAGTCTFLIYALSVTSDFLSQTTKVSFYAPEIPDMQGKGTASNANGAASAQITYLPTKQSSRILSLLYVQTPQGQATILQQLPSQGSTQGNFVVVFKLTIFRKVMTISDLSVSFGSTSGGFIPAVVQCTGFLSRYILTSFSVLAPPFQPGAVSVLIVNAGRTDNAGVGNFVYIDYSIAVLIYPVGPPWPQGDASISNLVFAGVSGLGAAVTSDSVVLTMYVSSYPMSVQPKLQLLQSTLDSTQL